MDDEREGLKGKELKKTRRRIEAIIKQNLGHYEVSKHEPKTITDWKNKSASSPARLRTAKGAEQNFREPADTDEARRRRRSSTNRILTILKAALNADRKSVV